MTHLDTETLGSLRCQTARSRNLHPDLAETKAQLEALMEEAKRIGDGIEMRTPFIHVVDDDEPFATAVCRVLRASGYNTQHYPSAGDFLLARKPDAPGCILLDVCLPGPSGLDLQESLSQTHVPLPVIFLSGCADIPTTVKAMKGGAVDFLPKPVQRETLIKSVEDAIARSHEMRRQRDDLRRVRESLESLTPRETEVFVLVIAGKMNKEIASELGAAERTIKAHRAQVMQKMQVASVAELVHLAEQLKNNGILAPRATA